MNWNQLQYVLTLAEEKSITRAAQKLYLTQPSLSLSLKSLEAELGMGLLALAPALGGSVRLEGRWPATPDAQAGLDWLRLLGMAPACEHGALSLSMDAPLTTLPTVALPPAFPACWQPLVLAMAALAALRSGGYTITIDGAEIPVDKITSENFTVRWSSMKYEHFDGWHVDGVLVAKSARFSVTKTFSGDDTAVAKVKEHWSAEITHVLDGDGRELDVVTDYVLSLNSAEDESDPAKTGYTSYDPATDTYQWTLVARNKRQYTLTESGHTIAGTDLDPAQWEQSFQYSIRGSDSATGGSLPYADVVQLQAEAYPDDVPDAVIQTVELRNLYVRAGVLTLYKADSLTGDGIGGVQFSVSRADGGAVALFRKPDTSSYYIPSDGQPDSEHTQPVEDGLLTCDPNGYLYLKLAPYAGQTSGAYDLTERIPSGYEGAQRLRITVTSDDLISFTSQVLDGRRTRRKAVGCPARTALCSR